MRWPFILLTFTALLLPQTAPAESKTFQEIEKRGTIRIGYRDNNPPMSFLGEDNQPVGYSIDLCQRIANEVKSNLEKPDIQIEYVPVTAGDRFEALQNGKIDILCGATTLTLSRREIVDFTQHTFVTGTSLLSLANNPVAGISELQGKKVAVVKDTTTIEVLARALEAAVSDAQLVAVDSAADGMQALRSGEVDAYASDQVVLIGLVLTNPGDEKFSISEELISFEPFALAIPKGDSDFRLLADRVISKLYRGGQIVPIYKKWFSTFSADVPQLLEAMYILNSTPE